MYDNRTLVVTVIGCEKYPTKLDVKLRSGVSNIYDKTNMLTGLAKISGQRYCVPYTDDLSDETKEQKYLVKVGYLYDDDVVIVPLDGKSNFIIPLPILAGKVLQAYLEAKTSSYENILTNVDDSNLSKEDRESPITTKLERFMDRVAKETNKKK